MWRACPFPRGSTVPSWHALVLPMHHAAPPAPPQAVMLTVRALEQARGRPCHELTWDMHVRIHMLSGSVRALREAVWYVVLGAVVETRDEGGEAATAPTRFIES